jgi:ABC-type dipeptide/oligopeptide/nickel transport system permease component
VDEISSSPGYFQARPYAMSDLAGIVPLNAIYPGAAAPIARYRHFLVWHWRCLHFRLPRRFQNPAEVLSKIAPRGMANQALARPAGAIATAGRPMCYPGSQRGRPMADRLLIVSILFGIVIPVVIFVLVLWFLF